MTEMDATVGLIVDSMPGLVKTTTMQEGTERCPGSYAVGLTFPEAFEAGMLPFQVIPLFRKGDPVSAEDCSQAMVDEGASHLFPDGEPELRFATEEEAKVSIQRLVNRLPGSEPVWAIARDVGRIESVGEFE